MEAKEINLKNLFESGVHYGHLTRYREPKMDKYIFGARNGINIINLEHTVKMMRDAMKVVDRVVNSGGNVLFVGTKFPARKLVEELATECGMPYVNYRWLGGMLTNYKTIKQSVRSLKQIEKMYESGTIDKLTKKEALTISRKLTKLKLNLGGIRDMTGLPELIFVLDAGQEKIAIQEANRLGIPVIGVVDTNSSPDGVDYVIPGNDDSMRSIRFYLENVAGVITKIKDAKIAGVANIEEESFVEVESEVEKDSVKEQDTSVSTKKAEADNK